MKSSPAHSRVTLKGKAMLAAIEAGMIHKATSADGYDIAPFLDFWTRLTPALQEMAEDFKQRGYSMLYDESSNGTYRHVDNRIDG